MDREAARTRIAQLTAEVRHHAARYHELDDPEISDLAYDQLVHELRALEAEWPEFAAADSPSQGVGAAPRREFVRVVHPVPMLSLEDVFSEDALYTSLARMRRQLDASPLFSCEEKIDGLSCALHYEDGRLVRAVTRGDGLVGEDVTANVLHVAGFPQQLSEPIPRLVVRVEVYMSLDAFSRLNERSVADGGRPFANPRNAAAGSLRQIDPAVTASRELSSLAFDVQLIEGRSFDSHVESLAWLAEQGFAVVEHRAVEDDEAIHEAIEAIASRRSGLDHDIDGAVLKVDRFDQRRQLGETSRTPRWAVAWKYPPADADTVVHDIVVQVGRTGKLTPLALLEPVTLSGSVVARATLHNEDFVAGRDIRVGDTVRVRKAGEIIPEVVAVQLAARPEASQPFVMPTRCPVCAAPAIREEGEAARFCSSSTCPAQRLRRIEHYCSRACMDIEGFGEAVIRQFHEAGYLDRISDLYHLHEHREALVALPGFGERSVEIRLAAVDASRERPLARLIAGLGIRHVGVQVARALAGALGSLDALLAAELEQLEAIPDVGPAIAASVHTFAQSEQNREELARLQAAGVNPLETPADEAKEEQDSPFSGLSVVLTGAFANWERRALSERLTELGATVRSSVSSRTDLVIHGEDAGSKLARARELNIRLMDEAALEAALAGLAT